MEALNEQVHARGDLEITVTDEYGEIVSHFAMHNTITFEGISGLLKCLIGDNHEINALKAGTNGTPPTRGDTALGAAVITKALTGPNRVPSYSTGTLVFQTQLGPAEAIGGVLREAGLFYADNTMFSRMTHPDIDRTVPGFGVLYVWRLTFTV